MYCTTGYEANISGRILRSPYLIERWIDTSGINGVTFDIKPNETSAKIYIIQQIGGKINYVVLAHTESGQSWEVDYLPNMVVKDDLFEINNLRPGKYTLTMVSEGCPCTGWILVYIN